MQVLAKNECQAVNGANMETAKAVMHELGNEIMSNINTLNTNEKLMVGAASMVAYTLFSNSDLPCVIAAPAMVASSLVLAGMLKDKKTSSGYFFGS